MLHLAFKLARVMAPTVIYIDEIEKVRQKGTIQSRREKYGKHIVYAF
jgi:ATP-dependent 26S proteasome regulatory subunit